MKGCESSVAEVTVEEALSRKQPLLRVQPSIAHDLLWKAVEKVQEKSSASGALPAAKALGEIKRDLLDIIFDIGDSASDIVSTVISPIVRLLSSGVQSLLTTIAIAIIAVPSVFIALLLINVFLDD